MRCKVRKNQAHTARHFRVRVSRCKNPPCFFCPALLSCGFSFPGGMVSDNHFLTGSPDAIDAIFVFFLTCIFVFRGGLDSAPLTFAPACLGVLARLKGWPA